MALKSTGNEGLDAFADVIAERVCQRLDAARDHGNNRLLGVNSAAEYIGRSPSALRAQTIAQDILVDPSSPDEDRRWAASIINNPPES